MAISIDQNILWLQVPVDDTVTVKEVNTTQDLMYKALLGKQSELVAN